MKETGNETKICLEGPTTLHSLKSGNEFRIGN
mgnify:CR=1 FL=1